MIEEKKMEGLTGLFEEYKNCTRCPKMCESRAGVIFGAGKITADLMIIAESPEWEDERSGMPMSGKGGMLLRAALEAAGLRHNENISNAYISSMVMCYPSNPAVGKEGRAYKAKRVPTAEEQQNCEERLLKEIYLVDPKVILLLGAITAKLATPAKLESAAGDLLYVEVPGKTEKITLRYPAVATWSPSAIGAGAGKSAASETKFYEHVARAVGLVNVASNFQRGVNNERA